MSKLKTMRLADPPLPRTRRGHRSRAYCADLRRDYRTCGRRVIDCKDVVLERALAVGCAWARRTKLPKRF